ncbi:MAG TPA: sigma 54-interacting transcriptional regulator [Polyangiaceae bacterium]|nr:sigma 54-interacting transcriptional regulator [Polyangiaceae bacterium]
MTDPGDFPTATEQDQSALSSPSRRPVLGFVVFWCAEQPSHLGAFLPVFSTSDRRPQILGRGGALATDQYARLEPELQRPGTNLRLAPFECAALSRSQLHVSATQSRTLLVANVGKCPMFHNGASVTNAEVRVGDLLQVGRQLTLLCVERPPQLPGEAALIRHEFGEPDRHGIVGESPSIWQLRQAIESIGTRPGHVLILGASGTGKELIARAVHSTGNPRGTFVARNAGTLPESLLDAELFGNAKGYPNAGMSERTGLIGAAHGGSLFLDEIAELPMPAQTHLLRVLDEGEYQSLGDPTLRRSSFRLIAATNQPESALRGDVQARFTFRIHTPDLAQRREDVTLIARFMLKKIASEDSALAARLFTDTHEPRLSPSLLRQLARHPFSNNVRELRNLLWQLAISGDDRTLEWHEPISERSEELVDSTKTDAAVMELQRALDANNGSIERTWRALGLPSRFAMMRLIKKHGLRIQKDTRKD